MKTEAPTLKINDIYNLYHYFKLKKKTKKKQNNSWCPLFISEMLL